MDTPDDLDLEMNGPVAGDTSVGLEKTSAGDTETTRVMGTRRNWRPAWESFAIRARRLAPLFGSAPAASSLEENDLPTRPPLVRQFQSWRRGRGIRKNRVEDWQSWSKFRLWRHTRPLWGSLLMICSGLLMMIGASFFLSLAFLVPLWPAFLVGGLLLAMGAVQLFLPAYAVITGSIGMVLAIVSLLVASFGGCGLGMLLGVIGSALSIAWRPVRRSRLRIADVS